MNKFTKQDTTILKGVAIVLMIAHHLFFFPARLPGGKVGISFTRIDHMGTAVYIGMFGKICVPLFLFLSGYGIYKTYIAGRLSIAERIYHLYSRFFRVCIVFLPIGFLFFSNQPKYCEQEGFYNAFSKFSLVGLVKSVTALGTCYNREWWFLKYYVLAILLFPLIYKVVKRCGFWENVWIVVAFVHLYKYGICTLATFEIFEPLKESYLYTSFIDRLEPYVASFWMGCIFAKDDRFEQMIAKYNALRLNTATKDCIALVVLVIVRNSIIGAEMDYLLVPILCVICRDLIRKSSRVSFAFRHLGKQSTNMWLTHTFFLYYFYACVKIVLMPRYAVLELPWLVMISFGASVLLDKIYRQAGELYQKAAGSFLLPLGRSGSEEEGA